MEHYDRPPILRKKRLLQIALIVLIPVFFGGLLLRCLSACIRLQQAQREAQNVSAVIYDVYGDDEYDVYIRYRYEGELYDVRYKSGTSDESWKNREGQTISVRINPRRPGELIEKMEINARNTVFALGFFNLWLLIPAMETRKKWTGVYGHGRIFIQRDLKDCVRRHTLWKWGLMTGAELIVVRLLFGEAITIWALPLGAVLILSGTMGMRHYLANLKKISNEEFFILENTVAARNRRRSRNSTKYYLEYTNENGSWECLVSSEEYNAAVIGQIKRGVYLKKEIRPILLLPENSTESV